MESTKAGRLILLYSAQSVPRPSEPEEVQSCLSGEPAPEELPLLETWLAELAEISGRECPSWLGRWAAVSGSLPEAFHKLPDWPDAATVAVSGEIRGKVIADGLPADLFVCMECDSTFDLAWRLVKQGLIDEWGAVLSVRQRCGRGQMRREWLSASGNLHVSFRLPQGFLAMEAASVLTALLLAEAFAALGLDLKLKWPNDLVLEEGGTYGKLGGILLEERGEVLLAGLGLNCAHRPDDSALRKEAAMQAAVLSQSFTPKTPIALWLELVQKMILLYEKTFRTTPTARLLRQSEKYLLWKGSEVQVRDHNDSGSVITGILCGLTELGGLRLLVPRQGVPPCGAPAVDPFGSPGYPGHSGSRPSGLGSGRSTERSSPRSGFSPGCAGGLTGFEELELYSGSLKGTD